MKFHCGALVLVVVAALLTGCAEGRGVTLSMECPRKAEVQKSKQRPKDARPAWVSLHRSMGPENVGVWMAEDRGYFDDVGIKLKITSASRPEGPVNYLETGYVDFGLGQQPQVVMARERGIPIIAVGSLIPRPTTAMIWLEKSQIDGIADLRGKTIAFPGISFQRVFLEHLLEEAGLTLEEVQLRRVGYFELVPALVKGNVDAIFGGSWNVDGTTLKTRGLSPVVTTVRRLGIPAYEELVVMARADQAAQDPQLIRDFMAAVARGNAAAIEDPRKAAELIEENGEADPGVGRKATEAGVKATLPLFAKTSCMDPEEASDLVDWMNEEGLIRHETPTSDLLTNKYLER